MVLSRVCDEPDERQGNSCQPVGARKSAPQKGDFAMRQAVY